MDEDLIRQQNRYAPATMAITLMSCDRNNSDQAFESLYRNRLRFWHSIPPCDVYVSPDSYEYAEKRTKRGAQPLGYDCLDNQIRMNAPTEERSKSRRHLRPRRTYLAIPRSAIWWPKIQ